MTETTQRVPEPLEWHPAYADMTYLLDWLNGTGPYHLRVAFDRGSQGSPLTASADAAYPTAPSFGTHMLTKHRCAGPAPYVGRPFKYLWTVAVDELGRAIASDTERWYNPDDDYRASWPDPLELPERTRWT